MSPRDLHEDRQLMAALALAMVRQPRASLQELAKAAGISKATLYRCSPTREQLHERLVEQALLAIDESIRHADLQGAAPREALRRLIENTLAHRELSIFLVRYWKNSAVSEGVKASWEQELDAFFLRGQKAGVFRVDIPAPALTELYASTLTGLIDAEQRGRIARLGLPALIETAFLHGTVAH